MEPSKKNYALLPDVLGVASGAFALLVFFSLLSFDVSDNFVYPHGGYRIQNWIGPGGALLSNALYTLFGFLAWILPVFLVFLSGSFFWRQSRFVRPPVLIGAFCLLVGNSAILGALGQGNAFISFPWGGLLGWSIHQGLTTLLHPTGMWIFSMSLSLIGVLLMGVPIRLRWPLRSPKKTETTSVLKIQTPSTVAKEPPAPWTIPVVEKPKLEVPEYIVQAEQEVPFELPPLRLLDYDAPPPIQIDERLMKAQAERLEKTFRQFGIEGQVREIRPGPVVTCFEFVPAPGIKLSRIAALADDIAMAMTALHVRIVAPIPGKGAVGIELPNEQRETVYLKEIVAHPSYREQPHKLCMAVGKSIEGKPFFVNLADMPHVLIAGTTGSGKSVSVNAMICSILYRATPQEVRFLMIDPKMLELSIYEGIPHLLLPPIIDSKKASFALKWAVREMDKRYAQMNEVGVRDIAGYNEKVDLADRMPFIVVVIDEYADLVAVAGKDVEVYVMRLAQKARAAGIHVMLATQRPSVDIITGVIKANFPVRMGFRLSASQDSKTIINRSGAEKLLGRGDMLMIPSGSSELVRVHGAFISEKELSRVVDFWKLQSKPEYDMSIVAGSEEEGGEGSGSSDSNDERYAEAIEIVRRTQKCSTSWLQRQMGVGYNRAAKMVDQMEREGVVGPILNAKGDRDIF